MIRRRFFAGAVAVACCIVMSPGASSQPPGASSQPPPLKIEDPFAAVDGVPITIGRLNLVLRKRFPKASSAELPMPVRQATALVLVRQQMAMNQLSKKGGESLARQTKEAVARQEAESKRRGVSLADQAATMGADTRAMVDQIRWQTAWSLYLRSRLTDANLKTFFEKHQEKYGGEVFEDMTDQGPLRRDATAALFELLVRSASDAKVVWFADDLRPPEGYQAHIE